MRKVFGLWLAMLLSIGPAAAQSTPFARTTPTLTDAWVVITGSYALVGLNAVIDTSVGGYILVYDRTDIPPDGPITPSSGLSGCFVVNPKGTAPSSETSMANTPFPIQAHYGLVLVYSTTGCLTQTKAPIMWATALID